MDEPAAQSFPQELTQTRPGAPVAHDVIPDRLNPAARLEALLGLPQGACAALHQQHLEIALQAIEARDARIGALESRPDIDDLTGVLRRGAGEEAIAREIARARRSGAEGGLIVAFVDVDGLKGINDNQGHAAGDALLRQVASALRSGVRSYDTVMRYGGDEFVCCLPGADVDAAQRILTAVAGLLATDPEPASISIGLATLREDDTVASIMARADAELYHLRRLRRRGAA